MMAQRCTAPVVTQYLDHAAIPDCAACKTLQYPAEFFLQFLQDRQSSFDRLQLTGYFRPVGQTGQIKDIIQIESQFSCMPNEGKPLQRGCIVTALPPEVRSGSVALIAGYILYGSFREIGPVIHILMLGSPPDIEADAVLQPMRATEGVKGIHHAHFWQMTEHGAALEAHVVIEDGRWAHADAIKSVIKATLRDRFDIGDATLELECARHACDETQRFGRDPGDPEKDSRTDTAD